MKLKDLKAVCLMGFCSGLVFFVIAAVFGMLHESDASKVFLVVGGIIVCTVAIFNALKFKCPQCKGHPGKGFKNYCTNCGCKIGDDDHLG